MNCVNCLFQKQFQENDPPCSLVLVIFLFKVYKSFELDNIKVGSVMWCDDRWKNHSLRWLLKSNAHWVSISCRALIPRSSSSAWKSQKKSVLSCFFVLMNLTQLDHLSTMWRYWIHPPTMYQFHPVSSASWFMFFFQVQCKDSSFH